MRRPCRQSSATPLSSPCDMLSVALSAVARCVATTPFGETQPTSPVGSAGGHARQLSAPRRNQFSPDVSPGLVATGADRADVGQYAYGHGRKACAARERGTIRNRRRAATGSRRARTAVCALRRRLNARCSRHVAPCLAEQLLRTRLRLLPAQAEQRSTALVLWLG